MLLAMCIQIECTYRTSYMATVTKVTDFVERIYCTIIKFMLVFRKISRVQILWSDIKK